MPKYIQVGNDVVEFPDTMSDQDIASVLSGQQKQQPTAEQQRLRNMPYSEVVADATPVEESTQLGPVGRAVRGFVKGAVVDPMEAITQIVGGESGRRSVAEREKSYQEGRARAGDTGLEISRIAGQVLSPASIAGAAGGAKIAQIASAWKPIMGSKVGIGAAAGAGAAATLPVSTPEEESDKFFLEKAKDIGLSSLAGGVVAKIGSAIAPQLKQGAAEQMAKGVTVSPGQAYEGIPGWVFRQMESIGFGPTEKAIRNSFTRSAANEVLSSIDETLPKAVKDGMQASGYAQNRISKFYESAFDKIGPVLPDAQFTNDITAAVAKAQQEMTGKAAKAFSQEVRNNVINKFQFGPKPPAGTIAPQGMVEIPVTSGAKLKEMDRYLKAQIDKYGKGTDSDSIARAAGYEDLLNSFRAFTARVDDTGLIAKADEAWAKLYRFADASQKGFAEAGDFTAEQLAQAAIRQGSTLQAGAGKAPMQEFAQEAVNIIGKEKDLLPLGYRQAVIGGKLATGTALAVFNPQVAIPLLVASGMSFKAAERLMKSPSATRIAVEKAIQKIGPSSAAVIIQNAQRPEAQTQQ